ncbi:4Fe-4S binding protein [uncultured Oscillibacter sp.]|uniref:4Fe-4S binding protein n=1 Tax=uncultured Oscillibacter sp. TaxID=876091 RepID=UPI002804C1B1|nr:4Fe-4S binding protein [uncultured Oscillibacter sp.]
METSTKKRRSASVDQAHCVACGCCKKVCPMDAIAIWRGVTARIDPEKCIGCGKCAKECPASVIVIREAAV